MLKKIFILAGIIVGLACAAVYFFPQFGRTMNCIVAAGATEVGLGWSVKENPAEAVKEAIAMALDGKKNKNPDIAIMFVNTGNNMRIIQHKAKRIFSRNTKIYGGTSDPSSLCYNRGFIYVKGGVDREEPAEPKKGIVIITISSKEVVFGVGSSGLSESRSVRAAAKTAALNAIASVQRPKVKCPRLAFLMSMPGSENEAVRGAKEVLDRSHIILCGSAQKSNFRIFAENRMYSDGVAVAVVYTDLPIGLNVIKRSYKKIQKPTVINSLLALRSYSEET